MVDDQYLINTAKSEVREGYNSADAERILANYDDDFNDLSFGMPAMDGDEPKIVLRERLRRLFANYKVAFFPIVIAVQVNGETAITRGWHHLTITSVATGAISNLRTRYVEFWKKDTEGRWRIAFVIDNLDQPPMMLEEIVARVRQDRFDETTRMLS